MFELHNDGPCILCKGAEDHDQFDYCRACGFTLFTFRKQSNYRQEIAALVEEIEADADEHLEFIVYPNWGIGKILNRLKELSKGGE